MNEQVAFRSLIATTKKKHQHKREISFQRKLFTRKKYTKEEIGKKEEKSEADTRTHTHTPIHV